MSTDLEGIVLDPRIPIAARPLEDRLRRGLDPQQGCPDHLQDLLQKILAAPELAHLSEADRLTARLFFEVLQDLANQHWRFEYRGAQLLAFPPNSAARDHGDREEIKRRLRASLVAARNEQLREEPVKRFVLDLERPRWHGWRKVSVLDLLLSPGEFAADLRRIIDAPEKTRHNLLKESVQPYLQMATEERDEFTGIRLVDVWRYCRYTWSLPLSQQPGRGMLYLVRDAAREFHPIIGIGALGNSVVQLSSRDEEIGWWSSKYLKDTLDNALKDPDRLSKVRREIPEKLPALQRELDRTIGEILWEDLLSEEEVIRPTPGALKRLRDAAAEASALNRSLERAKSSTLVSDALSPAFRRKRALELHRLLLAKRVLQKAAAASADKGELTEWLLTNEEGRNALGVALRTVKKRHVGSSMMDITTCGALPPYSEVLGGKLVALLMASPQVIADYRERYANTPSEIASRMRGAEVIRPAHLVLLGTTSLYSVGSSQYNRLKAQVANGKVAYVPVGETQGYGSVHISRRTYKTLQELLRRHPLLEPQSNTFAAGVKYKMRSIESGLSHLGLSKLQEHKNRRLVYLVPLVTNWREYLTGLDNAPNYIYSDLDNLERETSHLIEFWKDRWFVKRASRPETLQSLELRGERALRVSDSISHGHDDLGAQPKLFQ